MNRKYDNNNIICYSIAVFGIYLIMQTINRFKVFFIDLRGNKALTEKRKFDLIQQYDKLSPVDKAPKFQLCG